jgi:hypothetical protein
MTYYDKPHFVIKKNLQKSAQTGVYFSDVVTVEVLKDVCERITSRSDFTYSYVDNDYQDEFLDTGYNKGRMAIMCYKDIASFISFSEKEIDGRNSSVQSVPTAFNIFYMNQYSKKKLYYYFLNFSGNAGTDYQMLTYRLMETIGFNFLNDNIALGQGVVAFTSIEDIMYTRRANSSRNQSNNSTYITKSSISQYDIYGKTYGANKYETSMICYALSSLAQPNQSLTLYEVLEGKLAELPEASLNIIRRMNNIAIVPTDIQLEKNAFIENNSLRSPRYIYNLLNRLGRKHCAFCNCEIPELIQGAHVWPVAEIKKVQTLTLEQKLSHAISGENGIWLCENHHKMFDEGLLCVNANGQVNFKEGIEHRHISFMDDITTHKKLSTEYLTNGFMRYLDLRNSMAG